VGHGATQGDAALSAIGLIREERGYGAMDISGIGRLLITSGVLLLIVGLILALGGKIPFLGRLPGDIVFRKDGFTFFAPIVTMLIISLLLTIIINIILRIFR
jgi:hypothetical protein